MAAGHRLTITSIDPDPRGRALVAAIAQLGLPAPDPDEVAVADLVFVDGPLSRDDLVALEDFLVDPLLQRGTWSAPTAPGVEITYLAGVTDGAAAALMHAAAQLGVPVKVAATGRRVEFGRAIDPATADDIVRRVVANPIIERWAFGSIEPDLTSGGRSDGTAAVVPVRELSTSRARAGRRRSRPRPRSRRAGGRAAALRRRGS